MSIRLQSPQIATQLRQALSLDGAGSFGMDMEQIVLPVAIVADVRNELVQTSYGVASFADSPAVAARNSRAAFQWGQFPPEVEPFIEKIILDRITISTTTTASFHIGIGPASAVVAVNQTALPFKKLWSARTALVAGRAVFDDAAGSMNVAQAFALVNVLAGEPYVLELEEPIILDQLDAYVAITCGTVNVGFRAMFEWRELLRG